jgi:hypothetical protein
MIWLGDHEAGKLLDFRRLDATHCNAAAKGLFQKPIAECGPAKTFPHITHERDYSRSPTNETALLKPLSLGSAA